MTPTGRPRFEVIVGASAADRRLVHVDTIRALTGFPSTGDGAVSDETLGLWLDAEIARAADSCDMATYRGLPPTLAQESVRVTFPAGMYDYRPWCLNDRSGTLLLPWRAPITAITITVGDVELVENVDYQLVDAGVVERLSGNNGVWCPGWGGLVVDYVAGFVPLSPDASYQPDGATLPANVVALLADQVRLRQDSMAMNLNLRSEDVPGIWSGTYNVAGGDAIDTSGLMRPLWDALAPYRAPPGFA
jgi:hypothetical protein